LSLTCSSARGGRRLSESERVEYFRTHHTWPPTWQNESDGYRALMEQREREIMEIPGSDERWENWMQFVSGRMVPSFTPNGFKIAQAPPEIFAKLESVVKKGLENWDNLRYEHEVDAIYCPPDKLPKFIDLREVAREVHLALLPMHEEWAGGMKLKPTSAYGVRMYQNGSSLVMHNDKIESHVISSILHIAHDYEDENRPWPIEIEGLDGQLYAESLQPGQLLFYESAKCLHGRMTELRGRYYGSLFLHYQPVDRKLWDYDTNDVINAVPPHWHDNVIEDKGSRWAGASVTTDSRVAAGAPPRLVGAANPRNRERSDEF